MPKGVVIPHRAVVRLACVTDYVQLSPADTVAHLSNPAFDAATFEIWGSLLNGSRIAVIPRDAVLSLSGFTEALDRHGVTTMFLTTALFNQIARDAPAALARRQVLFGGEAVEPRWVAAALRGRPAVAAAARLRPDGDDDVCDVARDTQRRCSSGDDPDRAADREHRGLSARRARRAGAPRGARRDPHRRTGTRNRLPRPSRSHRGAVHRASVRSDARRAPLPDRRPRTLSRRRHDRIRGPRRPAGEDPRSSDRARRSGGGARPPAQRARSRRA